jgi:uncharacterized membrane protein
MSEVITALFVVVNIVGIVFVIVSGGARSIKELKEGVRESSVFELILFLLLLPVLLVNLLLIFFRWKPFK